MKLLLSVIYNQNNNNIVRNYYLNDKYKEFSFFYLYIKFKESQFKNNIIK